MNFKLKGRDLLNGDIVLPEIPYATFSEEISKEVVKKMVLSMNYGDEFIKVYEGYRSNMHIGNVLEMLKELEDIYGEYSKELYTNQRRAVS